MTGAYIFASVNVALCAWSIGVGISTRRVSSLIPVVVSAAAAGICIGKIAGGTP